MKTKLSIKARLTLWYAALLLIICASAAGILYAVSRHAQTAYFRETLESAKVVILDELEIEHGVMEIDQDIDEVPNVYASLLAPDGSLIYGRRRTDAPFEAGRIRSVQGGGHSWMILDTLIQLPEYAPVWLRLYMSADLSRNVEHETARLTLWLLPLLAGVALLGGYALTRRALQPVAKMARMASGIADGGDLALRVEIGEQKSVDELDELAGALNAMLARLESSFERERRFTDDAAHELRTPLNAINTLGEYALSLETLAEKDDAVAGMLDKAGEMRQLVDQLLMLARLDAGQTPIEDGVALDALIENVAQDMLPVAGERGMTLETRLCSVSVRANALLVTRCIVNLADNAIRYGREGGRICITLEKEPGYAVIHVQDDGPGMEQDALAHVFDRFWRGDSARSTQGTGIGLAIVMAAARTHGGSAHVHSEKGAGCRFTLKIPADN